MLGYRQSGDSLFKFVDTMNDQELIRECFDYVKEVISNKNLKIKNFNKKFINYFYFLSNKKR